jgi:hypothetical protein
MPCYFSAVARNEWFLPGLPTASKVMKGVISGKGVVRGD